MSWRADAMRAQIPTMGMVPFLVAVPKLKVAPDRCLSCGEAFALVGSVPRCRLCTLAATQALTTPAEAIAQAAPAAASYRGVANRCASSPRSWSTCPCAVPCHASKNAAASPSPAAAASCL